MENQFERSAEIIPTREQVLEIIKHHVEKGVLIR